MLTFVLKYKFLYETIILKYNRNIINFIIKLNDKMDYNGRVLKLVL